MGVYSSSAKIAEGDRKAVEAYVKGHRNHTPQSQVTAPLS